MTALARRRRRGTSLVESAVSLGVLAVTMVGVTQMQLVAARSNHMARHASLAAASTGDMVEQIETWPYEDPRLGTARVVADLNDNAVKQMFDLGASNRNQAAPRVAMDFTDQETGANQANANKMNGATWQGQPMEIDMKSGKPIISRYWAVFKWQPAGETVERGKLVVVVSRWHEPLLGWRQFVASTYRINPKALNQVD